MKWSKREVGWKNDFVSEIELRGNEVFSRCANTSLSDAVSDSDWDEWHLSVTRTKLFQRCGLDALSFILSKSNFTKLD